MTIGRSRAIALSIAIAVIAAGAGLGIYAAATRGRPKHPPPLGYRPNIVLVLTDDQRADTLDAMPNVRALLAAHGVTFSNMFVTTSLCCPSRASILSGEYSRHTGVYDNFRPHGGAPSFRDTSTLATWLHDAGYTTALVGKYLNKYDALGKRYIPAGWDTWDAIASESAQMYYGFTLNEDGRLVDYPPSPANYSTTVLDGLARRFVERARAPFFLYYAPIAPHVPSIPAPQDQGTFAHIAPYRPLSYDEPDVSDKPWNGRYGPLSAERRAFVDRIRPQMLESLQAVDRSVADLVRVLRARGELDRTVIAFTSDNGYLWGEHRLVQKIWFYEPSIRVPLVVRMPGPTPTWWRTSTSPRPSATSRGPSPGPRRTDGAWCRCSGASSRNGATRSSSSTWGTSTATCSRRTSRRFGRPSTSTSSTRTGGARCTT